MKNLLLKTLNFKYELLIITIELSLQTQFSGRPLKKGKIYKLFKKKYSIIAILHLSFNFQVEFEE